jgi:hypothetical protein
MIPQINAKTIIDKGFPLSNNFLVDHVSTGAYHPILAEWVPKYTAILNPQQPNGLFGSNLPLWQIFRSLQIGSNGVLENILSQSGNLLVLKSGFLNNIPNTIGTIAEMNHLTGQSFDIGIKGYEDNVYGIAKEIQKIAKQASSIDVVYGSSSFFHINFDPKQVAWGATNVELPTMRSIDLIDGEVVSGIAAMRGY